MKKVNKVGLVFILLLVLSIGVVFLPAGFALQSPEDLVGKVYDSSIGAESEPIETIPDGTIPLAFYFYSSEESLNKDLEQVGDLWEDSMFYHRDGEFICYNIAKGPKWGQWGNTCIENENNKLANVSQYWKIIKYIGLDAYTRHIYALVPYEYKEPTYELSCNPEKISIGEYSDCSLKATYYSKMKNIDFNLNINDYEISNIKVGDDFDNLKVEDNNYSLIGKSSMEESDDGKETTIISFRITSQTNKEVNLNDNIKIENINYKDQVEEGTKNIVTATVKQKVTNNDIIKNPNTGKKLLVIVLFVIAILGICTIVYRKKESRYRI